jgi:hypothetical protein
MLSWKMSAKNEKERKKKKKKKRKFSPGSSFFLSWWDWDLNLGRDLGKAGAGWREPHLLPGLHG